MSDELTEVVWRKGAGSIVDADGVPLNGGETGRFEPGRAKQLVMNRLADWPDDSADDETDAPDPTEDDNGDNGFQRFGGGDHGDASNVDDPDGDDTAGLD